LGPNINLPLDAERATAAHAALQRAIALAPKASPAEQAYIAALTTRYSDDPNADRKALDRAYADAMRQLARSQPDDLDASTLFAESLMDLRPWDLWSPDGQPRPETPEIVATLEGVLQKDPNHPGANHYYIHAIEASPEPEKGLPSAQRLPALVPGAGHLVHMPAHVYMRTGRYADAAEANRQAIAVDERYIGTMQPAGVYPMMYYPHSIHFLWAAATMDGRSSEAVTAARQVATKVPPGMAREMPMVEYFMPTPYFALVRFGRWEEILAEPAPPDDLLYDTAMWHYARGLAYAATNRFDQALQEESTLKALAAQIPADRIVGDNQPADMLLRLASLSLAGEIAARQGNCERAIPKLEEAVSVQDSLPYMEPSPWYIPQRQVLGAVFLQCHRPETAEDVFLEDLRRNVRMRVVGDIIDMLTTVGEGRTRDDAVMVMASAYRSYAHHHPGRYSAFTRMPLGGDDPEFTEATRAAAAPVISVLTSYGLDGEEAFYGALEFWSAMHGFVLLEMTGVMNGIDTDSVFTDMVMRLASGMEKR